jgi:hypothetical protein
MGSHESVLGFCVCVRKIKLKVFRSPLWVSREIQPQKNLVRNGAIIYVACLWLFFLKKISSLQILLSIQEAIMCVEG